jgi:formate hydrogenlyase transcriptional activator
MSRQTAKYEALLRISQAIASNRDIRSLMNALAELLHSVVQFEYFDILLYDETKKEMTFIFTGTPPRVDGTAWEDGPAEWVMTHQRPFICSFDELELRYPKIAWSRERTIAQSICVVPLTTAQRRLGCMEFVSVRPNAYSEKDAYFMRHVASQVAVAVDNALNYEAVQASEQKVRLERDHLSTLLKVTNAVGSKRDIEVLLQSVSRAIFETFGMEHTFVLIHNLELNRFRVYAPCAPSGRNLAGPEENSPIDQSPWGKAFTEEQRCLVQKAEIADVARSYRQVATMVEQDIEAFCCVPLITHSRCVGVLVVAHKDENAFSAGNLKIIDGIADQLAIGIENALAYQEIAQLKDRLASEKLYLEEEIRTDHNFGEIIGQSDALRDLLSQVEMVASSDSTALILGETGTGKELIARAIHQLSGRRDRALIKLNCPAIPLGLLESELFGHEKGAFTGAVAQKIGRLELAHQGTLFLDEVGEIPLEVQPKLLRAIQEQEIERLGGTRVIRVDVRIIAATNRDIKQMVADHQFRSDLFYRLSVFPLRVPPLRQRQADIPLLVRHFIQKHALRMKRDVDCIPTQTMQLLCQYSWPGNVRELQNLIERSVIVSKGPILNVPTVELMETSDFGKDSEFFEKLAPRKPQKTERDLIVRTLRETGGVVSGPNGAAAKLGLKRSTLVSRMKRLGLYSHGIEHDLHFFV